MLQPLKIDGGPPRGGGALLRRERPAVVGLLEIEKQHAIGIDRRGDGASRAPVAKGPPLVSAVPPVRLLLTVGEGDAQRDAAAVVERAGPWPAGAREQRL